MLSHLAGTRAGYVVVALSLLSFTLIGCTRCDVTPESGFWYLRDVDSDSVTTPTGAPVPPDFYLGCCVLV